MLQAASVIGKDVPLVLLQAIADLSEDETRRNLTILQTGDFLHELRLFPSMEYTFRHTLTQEVAHDTLLRERRRALHARVMEALEQLHADRPGEQVESLAHHALRGEVWHKAVPYLRQAGAKAAARGANREAVGFLEQALAALSHLPDSPERSEQAIDLRLDLRPPLLQMGQLDRVLTLSQEAEAMAQQLGDEPRLARVYTYLVNYYYLKGEPDLAIEYGERCLRIGETVQDRSLQALARGYLGYSYHAQGRFLEAERVLRQNLEALGGAPADSATIQNRISFVTSAAWVAFTHADLGDFDAAIEDLDQAARAAKATGHPFPQAIAQTLAGLVHLRRGQLEAALPLLAAERGRLPREGPRRLAPHPVLAARPHPRPARPGRRGARAARGEREPHGGARRPGLSRPLDRAARGRPAGRGADRARPGGGAAGAGAGPPAQGAQPPRASPQAPRRCHGRGESRRSGHRRRTATDRPSRWPTSSRCAR